jgi:GxxExxY protein
VGKLILEEESYKIIGIAMEVHRVLGPGFPENVYKDALAYEFKCSTIDFDREKSFVIGYKNIILPRRYLADFVVFSSIILEIKAKPRLVDGHFAQTLNYLKISEMRVALLINFGELSLKYKRFIT